MHEDTGLQGATIESSQGISPGQAAPSGAAVDVAVRHEIATDLAHERTDMAALRSYMALERTLMAWIRTSLSMIGFGFTIGKLGQALGTVEMKRLIGGTRTVNVESLAYALVLLGTLALLAAALQSRYQMRELYAAGLHRKISLAFIVSLLLTAFGGLALTSLVTSL
jgi:putative membrane protein